MSVQIGVLRDGTGHGERETRVFPERAVSGQNSAPRFESCRANSSDSETSRDRGGRSKKFPARRSPAR